MASTRPRLDLIQLAHTLPQNLRSLLQRYPPTQAQLQALRAPTSEQPAADPAPDQFYTPFLSPFRPHKDPATGIWHKPVYSLRQQADLFKAAKEYGLEGLLPYTIKNTGEKSRKRAEHGLRVKGTGIGQQVKGHRWERTLKPRLEERRQAMLGMSKLIREWKERGHGRGWKKWPK